VKVSGSLSGRKGEPGLKGVPGLLIAEAFVSCGLGGAEIFIMTGLCGADCALSCLAGHHSTYFKAVLAATFRDVMTGGGAAATRTAGDNDVLLTR